MGARKGVLQECLSHTENEGWYEGFDRGGRTKEGRAVGGALRNAWKVSVNSVRLWTANPRRYPLQACCVSIVSSLNH